MANQPQSKLPKEQEEVSLFMKNLWFFLLYFALLLMIASFGLIAEA